MTTPWVPLKRMVDPHRPITYGIVQAGPDVDGGVPYIRPVDMDDERGVRRAQLLRTSPTIANAYSRSTVRTGDLVVSIGPSFGKVMVVPPDLDGSNLTQGTARVSPRTGVARDYLFWALRSATSIAHWTAGTAGATFRALTLELLASTPCPWPPFESQRAVADHLNRATAAMDAVVERKHRLIGLLRERRGAVVDRAVRRGLENVPFRESGVEWLGQVPEHWETRPLITTVTATQNGTWGDDPTGTPTDVACVRVADFDRLRLTVQDRELTQRTVAPDELARYRLRPGNLLLEKSGGGDVQPVGKVVLFDRPVDAVCSNFVARLSIRSDHDPRYCAYLHDVLYRSRVNVRSIKQSTGIQNLDSDSYLREVVAVPPFQEQRSIADYLDHETAELDRLVASIRLQIAKLDERRSTLITSRMMGQVDAAHHRSDEA